MKNDEKWRRSRIIQIYEQIHYNQHEDEDGISTKIFNR